MASIIDLREHTTGPIPAELLELLPPTLHVGKTKRTVKREDVEALGPDERRQLWFDGPSADGEGLRAVWPFYDDTGVFGLGPAQDIKPFLRRRSLIDKGWTDEKLEAERQRLFGDREPGDLELRDDVADSIPLMERRWAVWDAVLARIYQEGLR